MESVGQRILNYLERKGISIDYISEKIEVTPNEFKNKLEKNALEIKTLEKISKELRIPLYSFFTNSRIDGNSTKKNVEIPYYIERLEPNEKSEFNNLISGLVEEIETLKRIIEDKDNEIEILKRLNNR
jgi:transcriptional regulator with XRE-family HTH domain